MVWGAEAKKLAEDPFFGMAEKEASALIQKYGVSPEKNPVQYLHYIKSALDSLANKSAAKRGNTLAQAGTHGISDTRDSLMKLLAPEGSKYAAARDLYKELSAPINQMNVGRYLAEKITPPTKEFGADTVPQLKEAFVRAIQDSPKTIKSASGRDIYSKLSDVMSPEQMNVIQDIGRNIGAEAEVNALGGFGYQNIAKAFSGTSREFKGLPVLSRVAMIGNAIIGRLQGRANEKVLTDLAQRFEDPKQILALLEEMPPKQRAAVIQDASNYAKKMMSSVGTSGQEMGDLARRAALTTPIVAGAQRR